MSSPHGPSSNGGTLGTNGAGKNDADPGRVLLETPVGWGLSGARSALRRAALRGGLTPERVDDLVIAANEVLTNALIHGGGGASLRVSSKDGWLICRIGDAGSGFEGSSAGQTAPDLKNAPQGGMGLWIVRRLCDEVSISRADSGAVVTLRMKTIA